MRVCVRGSEPVCPYVSTYMWLYLLEGEKKSFFYRINVA